MSSKLVDCIAILIILSFLVSPAPLLAEADDLKYLTLPEHMFLVGTMPAKINIARDDVSKWRGIVGSNMAAAVNGEIFKAGKFPKKIDCFAVAPNNLLEDISYTWNTFVCREFDVIGRKAESIQNTLRDENFSTFSLGYLKLLSELSDIRSSLNNIESELSQIEKMIADRKDKLIQQRKLAKEAEQEAKDALKLGDDFCFIATAAYGTPTAVEIDILRHFRDEYLRKSPLGNKFIEFYYNNSPPVAKFISENEILRVIVRDGFVEPVVKIVKFTENQWAK